MVTHPLTDIRSLSLADIEKFFLDNNEKAFRAHQVYAWLWKKHAGHLTG